MSIKVVPIIPSLNPNDKLIKYVEELIEIGFKKIIIVNDGSCEKYDKYFDELKVKKECIVLRHFVNQGKGRALKTAFNYYLENFSNYQGVVTADSDGQHSAKDTYNVALEVKNKTLVLGTRNFDCLDVPLKSKTGNKITTFVFQLLYGRKINDTQTGLRGISNDFVKSCLFLSGEKFDYEINMLIRAVKDGVIIKECLIDTIYIDDNKSSHFNPLNDSVRIYKVIFSEFLKFTFSGIFSFLIDILLFHIFVKYLFGNLNSFLSIILSTVFSRLFSSFINFILNKKFVFNSHDNDQIVIIKYYTLCIIQLLFSSLLVSLFYKLNIFSETVCKIIIDSILFLISYNIQNRFIFRKQSI